MLNLKVILMESTVLFLVLSCLRFASVINGYSFNDCTIKGPLRSNSMKVLCYKKHLRVVPENIPCRARVLDISYNKISVIKKNNLIHLYHLQHLNVTNNQIKDVEEGSFRDLVALQELNLSHNNISTITGEFFQNLFNLTVLRLDENKITNINSSAFASLVSLLMLNLSGNYLHHIYKVQPVFQIPSIQELHIGKNGFTSFQTCQVSNTSLQLKILDLSMNPLYLFSITADVFPQLQTLDLALVNVSMNWDVKDKNYLRNVNRLNLSGIPMELDKMKSLLQTFNSSLNNLRLYNLGEQRVKSFTKAACLIKTLTTLRLENNDMKSISEEELQNCTQLNVLDLAENRLTSITAQAFKSMNILSSLSFSHNKLCSVPAAIRNLSSLEILDLSYNSITTITCLEFTNLPRLQTLHIYRNPLSSLNRCAFQELCNLNTLVMGGSRLFTLKSLTKGLQNLEFFHFSEAKLSIINTYDFKGLQSLKHLHLEDNQIETIEPGAFKDLHNLTLLDLQSNKITQNSMQSAVFSGLKNLKKLQLHNNHISYSNQNRLKEPPFKFLKSLETLAIFSQRQEGMKNLPSNFLEGLTSLKIFWAGNININSLHPDTFIYTPNLWQLDLSKNYLISLSSEILLPLKHLCNLAMVNAGLQSLDFLVQANLKKIRFLLIRKNSIAVINKTVIDSLSQLFHLDLQGNDFSCDCENAWFIEWAVRNNDTQVLNPFQFRCNYPSTFRGSRLMDFDMDSCIVDVGLICFISTTSLVLLTLLTSFLYNFLKWQVLYAYYLFLAFLYDKKQKKKQQLQDFQYDAFVSYNAHDELWVMKELFPQLEGQQGWRLCLHHRDFQPGKPIIDNIVDGIYKSRKTICVISHNYLESEWCSREIQVASFRLFDEKKDVLILVFLEDIPSHQLSPHYRMRSIIRKRTYLRWPKPGEDTHVFWNKLRVALGSIRTSEK